ncbi:MAG: homocysteine S-methyltransferase family protein [Candidatus Omnitrophica bacterium]|nr:homocysteine S-methyltransferase family protein [Candidatus Omnitrophota bacterium]
MKIFNDKKIVILDGAMGTYLEKIGYKGITPEIANIEKPEIVEKIHSEYCENGAEIILTNTFGANRIILDKKKLGNALENIIKNGVEIAIKVKNKFKNIFIAGDIGPTGEILQPYGTLAINEAKKVYFEVGKIFEMTSVDFLTLETFQDLEELKIAYEILRETTSLFIIPLLTFTSGKEYRTLMGQKIEDFVKWAEKNKILIIGSNCGVSSKEMVDIVKIIRSITNLNLWIKPNAGKPQLKGGDIIYSEDVEVFGENCLRIVEMGVKFIGGCCGTTPSYINYLKNLLVH